MWLALTALVLTTPARWTPVVVETPDGLNAGVSHIAADGLAIGRVFQGSFGPGQMTIWQHGSVVTTIDLWSNSTGHVIDDDGFAWGTADLGTNTLVLRATLSGDVLQTWHVPTDPAFTQVVGALDGEAVVRSSAGSGSSFWSGRICRADGTVEPIAWYTSLYVAAMGRLPSGERITVGSIEEGGWWRGFMRSMDAGPDAEVVNLSDTVPVGSDYIHADSVSTDGWFNLRFRDTDFNWRPLRWNIDGSVVIGPPMPFVSAMDIDPVSGVVVTSGLDDSGVSAVWRWRPGHDAEFHALLEDDIGVLNLAVDERGIVVMSVLTQNPTYGEDLRVWLPGSSTLIDAPERTMGMLPDGDLRVLGGSGHGDVIVQSLQGDSGMLLYTALPDADANGDHQVNVNDLLDVIAGWGIWSGPCGPDLNFDGVVDVDDILIVLGDWAN